MRSVRATIATLAACSVPLLAACDPGASSTTSAESSASSAAAALSSSAAAAMSSASAAMSSASAAMSSSANPALSSASQHATAGTTGTQAVSFRMPDMRGQVLQDAQNTLHTEGVFYSRSHDLRGVRHQVLDRDWKVCSQNVPAGQQVSGDAEGAIDFGVVKLSETCP